MNLQSAIEGSNKTRTLIAGNYYVLKEIETEMMSDKDTQNMLMEIELLQRLNSHFIVGYIDSYTDGTKIYIVMEHCQNGDLCTYMEKNKKVKFGDNFIWKCLIHVCLGLYHLHSQNIVHRDLKTLNVFLTKDKTCKLGDFGEARQMDSSIDLGSSLTSREEEI